MADTHFAFSVFSVISMDEYAKKIYLAERSNKHEAWEFRKKCQALVQLDESDKPNYGIYPNEELDFFNKDLQGHPNFYRKEWIDNHQKAYCSQHPSDTYSCKAKKKNLYDLNQYNAMSKDEQSLFIVEQFCKMFPKAHHDVKNDPWCQNFAKKYWEYCPKQHTEF